MRASDLTPAERLLVHRRRLGATQDERAAALGVPLWTYRRWEAGTLRPTRTPTLGKLERHEIYFVARRRFGMTRKALAAELGLSEFYVTLMERGAAPVDRLAEYWDSP